MPNIIKSVAVVDSRPAIQEKAETELRPAQMPILKQEQLQQWGVKIQRRRAPHSEEAYRDQLQELLIQVDDAKSQLRALRAQIAKAEESRRPKAAPRPPVDPGLNLADDKVYRARREELLQLADTARKEADDILAKAAKQAEAEAEAIRAKAYQEGLERGTQEAADSYRAEHDLLSQELKTLVERLASHEQDLLDHCQDDLVELSVAVAEKIVARQVEEGRATVVEMLRGIVERNQREEYLIITVAPDLLPVEAKGSQEVRELIESLSTNIKVVVDQEARPGTLTSETPGGITDASIYTQLVNLRQAMADEE